MPVVLPILAVVALGCCCGLALRRLSVNRLMSAFGGAIIATVLWVGGLYVLFWLTAPNELGAPLFGPIVAAFITALVSAGAAVCVSGQRGDKSTATTK